MRHLTRRSARCQNVTYGATSTWLHRRGQWRARQSEKRTAGKQQRRRGRRSSSSSSSSRLVLGPPRQPAGLVCQRTSERGVDGGHGPCTRGWCARRCSGRSERAISLAGMPFAGNEGSCPWLQRLLWGDTRALAAGQTARRSLLDAPGEGPGRQIISASLSRCWGSGA